MSNPPAKKKSMTWLLFALLTVFSWGVYGVLLHMGQMGMADKVNGRYMAFLWVGIAYFIVAILGPIIVLKAEGGPLNFFAYPSKGLWLSFIAGSVGAIGAFGVLLAFGAAPNPRTYVPVIMSIIFAGAPIVNAVVSMIQHPPAGGFGAIKWPFWIGILMAALGGGLVALFKPDAAPTTTAPKGPVAAAVENAEP
ncbi:MAG: hypothetical protein ABI680_12680 [Chthoniobacteraceae bacterium]